jgi:hypothetical protein
MLDPAKNVVGELHGPTHQHLSSVRGEDRTGGCRVTTPSELRGER